MLTNKIMPIHYLENIKINIQKKPEIKLKINMKKLFKRGRKPSQVSSQGLLNFAESISFNTQNYIPKDGVPFSLFRILTFGILPLIS